MRIKNKFTKILSLFLVITMVFSLCVSIHAGDSLNVKALEGESNSITEGVAVVRDEEYQSLKDAVNAVQSGDIIVLMKDIELSEVIRFKTNNITLDLNGHTISQADQSDDDSFFLRNESLLTICDKSLKGTGKIISKKITIYSTGSLNVESGTIENTENRHAVYMNGYGLLNVTDGKIISGSNGIRTDKNYKGAITIDGGLIDAGVAVYAEAGTVTVNGGTVQGKSFGVYIQNVTLNVTGGTISTTGSDAIRVHGNTKVDITGGDVKGNRASINATYTNEDSENSIAINIKGGNFTNDNANHPIVAGGPAVAGIPSNNQIKILISGGIFNHKPSYSYLTPGYTIAGEEGAWKVVNFAAEVVDAGEGEQKYYQTLQNAIANGKEVKLLGDMTECITIPANKEVTLDLNGYTLTGVTADDGKMGNVLTNNGTLIIKDSSENQTGTIMGGSDTGEGITGRSGIALVNNGICTIASGNIKRGDNETFGNYTVQNNKNLIVNGGNIENNSSNSSLIINCEKVNKDATLTINGGTMHQDSFIAVKNESGLTTINGGKICSNNYALQCWADTNVTGGTIEGSVVVFTYQDTTATLDITGGTIGRQNGTDKIRSCNYYYDGSSAENAPVLKISGEAEVNGELEALETRVEDGKTVYYICRNDKVASIKVSNGTFDREVPDYACANGFVSQVNTNGTYSVKSGISLMYKGGSLLVKDTFEKVNMRFSYKFALPEECDINDVELEWNWGTKKDNLNRTVKAVNYANNGDGTYTASLVINNIPVIDGGYERSIYAQFIANYNGEAVIDVMENKTIINEQSTKSVAHDMLLDNSITDEQKTYINNLIAKYESQNSDNAE